jgi:hypothetical protein
LKKQVELCILKTPLSQWSGGAGGFEIVDYKMQIEAFGIGFEREKI